MGALINVIIVIIVLLWLVAVGFLIPYFVDRMFETKEKRFVRQVSEMSGYSESEVRNTMKWWGLRYGHRDYDWSRNGARDLANEIMNET
jgi:hypothetical protein